MFVCLFVCLLTVLLLLVVGVNFQAARCSSEVHELANVSASSCSMLQLNLIIGCFMATNHVLCREAVLCLEVKWKSLVKECPLQRTEDPCRARARARG